MKKERYVVKGITSNDICNMDENIAKDGKFFLDKCEEVKIIVKLNFIEAIIFRSQINNYNKQYNSKIKLLKIAT